jgi:RNA polymerase sigma factor (sigma-70 family)
LAAQQLRDAIWRLGAVLSSGETTRLRDAELLHRYAVEQDESAFAELVRRHGAMVLGVCRRVLGDLHDAEDAFQAAFLLLVRKASKLQSPQLVANWLYGVALRTALEARKAAARRKAKEAEPRPPFTPDDDGWADLRVALDEELSRLPDKYRTPIVLCDLQGATRKDAARQLGWPEGTVASRLANGRALLAKRLSRRGVAVSGGILTARFGADVMAMCVPASLVWSTLRCARALRLGDQAVGGISTTVDALLKGVTKTMLLTKARSTAIGSFVVLLALTGTGGLVRSIVWAHGDAAQDSSLVTTVDKQAHFDRGAGTDTGNQENARAIAALFKYRVPFEVGWSESSGGGRIEIAEVWGTRPKIEVGGQYLVRGKYVLTSGGRGRLYFHLTGQINETEAVRVGDRLIPQWNNTGADLDLQRSDVRKGQGTFTLVHGMAGPGWFHLHLVKADKYETIANVYFGTGDNVRRTKF